MKNEINPVVAIVIGVVLVAIIGWFIYSKTGTTEATTKDNAMPAEASNKMREMMQKTGGPGGAPGGQTAPR